MSSPNTDRNLLIGILALQMDFISRDELVQAMNAWVLDKSKPLDELLIERKAIDEATRSLILALVDKHLEMHDDNPQQSLMALSTVKTEVLEKLNSIDDSSVDASLAVVATANIARADDTPFDVTTTFNSVSKHESTRFKILRPHAKGGLGKVSVAMDRELNREVALKEIQEHLADHHQNRSRFVLEAEITGGLEHPGIVPVYGLGTYDDGRPFYAMRFIRGDSLKEASDAFHKDRKPVSKSDFMSLEFRKLLGRFVDVCFAIEYAHSRGVLHRDLKPGNIMLGKYGETLVVDWGLSKVVGRDEECASSEEPEIRPSSGSGSAPTQLGTALGTPQFMSPEQAEGKLDQLGPASDVYSLGATLYYMLTGRTPFAGDDVGELLRNVSKGRVDPPCQVIGGVPKALDAICVKAMSMRASDRYDSPRQLADEVESWLADEPVGAFPEPLSVRASRWVKSHQTLAASTGLAVLIGFVAVALILGIVSDSNRKLNLSHSKLDKANKELSAAYEKETELRRTAESEHERTERTLATVRMIDAARSTASAPQRSLATLSEIPAQHRDFAWNILSQSAKQYHQITQCSFPMSNGSTDAFFEYCISSDASQVAMIAESEIWYCDLGTNSEPKMILDWKRLEELLPESESLFQCATDFDPSGSLQVRPYRLPGSRLVYDALSNTWEVVETENGSDDDNPRGRRGFESESDADLITIDDKTLLLVRKTDLHDGRTIELRVAVDETDHENRDESIALGRGTNGQHFICIRGEESQGESDEVEIATFVVSDLNRFDQYVRLAPEETGRHVVIYDSTSAVVMRLDDGATTNLGRSIKGNVWTVSVAKHADKVAFVHHMKQSRDIKRIGVTVVDIKGLVQFFSTYESENIKIDSQDESGGQVQWSSFTFGRKIDLAQFSDDGRSFCFVEKDNDGKQTSIHRVRLDEGGVGPTWRAHDTAIAQAAATPSGEICTVDVNGLVKNWQDRKLVSTWSIPDPDRPTSIAIREECVCLLSWKSLAPFQLTIGDWATVEARYSVEIYGRQTGDLLCSLPETVVLDEESGLPRKVVSFSDVDVTHVPAVSRLGRYVLQMRQSGDTYLLSCYQVSSGELLFEKEIAKPLRIAFNDDGSEALALSRVDDWTYRVERFQSQDGAVLEPVTLEAPKLVRDEMLKLIPPGVEQLQERVDAFRTSLRESGKSEAEQFEAFAEEFSMEELMQLQTARRMRAQVEGMWTFVTLTAYFMNDVSSLHQWDELLNWSGRMHMATLEELPMLRVLNDGRYFDFRHRTQAIRLHDNTKDDFPVIREIVMSVPLNQVWADLANDDKTLITLGPDRLLKFWSVETAELMNSFEIPIREPKGIYEPADRSRLLIWGDTGLIVDYPLQQP